MNFWLAILFVSFICCTPYAQAGSKSAAAEAASKKQKDQGQDGVVKVDGAAVYEAQNFDAPVMEYLDSGKVFKISKKIYPGVGGLGSFYKVRLRKGVFGYIADTDIAPKRKGGGDEPAPPVPPEEKAEKLPTDLSATEEYSEDEPAADKNAFYQQRYIGLGYYSVNFAEEISNNVKNANTPLYAIKKTGPTGFMGGVPLDMTMLFTVSAPSFYNNIASSTSGFMVFGDIMPFFPISESKAYMIYYGFGLMLRYSRWAVNLRQQAGKPAVDSEELAMGLEGELGTAFRFSRQVALRLDARYFWEKQRYFGFGGALEFKF